MPQPFLNKDILLGVSRREFSGTKPFPWHCYDELLYPEQFEALHENFPSLDLFEYHEGIGRNGQRPHNRYYLAYEESIYKEGGEVTKGVARHSDLPEVWQHFLTELQTNEMIRQHGKRLLGSDRFTLRFAWHVGITHSEVSPHVDSGRKLGTQIFYFNTDGDWEDAWGGHFLVLGGQKGGERSPDFSDFSNSESAPFLNNKSLLFRNTSQAWHGVKELTCPEGRYRRLFNVIFVASRSPLERIGRAARKALSQVTGQG